MSPRGFPVLAGRVGTLAPGPRAVSPAPTSLRSRFDALRCGWVAPLGPHVDAFEAEIADRVGVRAGLALGSAALHLALLNSGAAGVAVLVPSLTFAASANAVAYRPAPSPFRRRRPCGNVSPRLLGEAVEHAAARRRERRRPRFQGDARRRRRRCPGRRRCR